MGDGSIIPSDDEGDDGEEGGSDDEDDQEGEGENDREGDDQDDELEQTALDIPGFPHERDEITGRLGQQRGKDASSSPDIPLAVSNSHQHGFSGSPLKNVITPPQYLASVENSNHDLSDDEEAEGDLDDDVDENVHGEMGDGMHDEAIEPSYQMAHSMLVRNSGGIVSFDQSESGVGPQSNVMTMHHHLEGYAGEDEMLLDGDSDGGVLSSMSFPPGIIGGEGNAVSIHTPDQFLENTAQEMETAAAHVLMETDGGAEGKDEDGFEDLLGSLEDHLNDQAPIPVQNEKPIAKHRTVADASAAEAVAEPVAAAVMEELLVKEDGKQKTGAAEPSQADEGAGKEVEKTYTELVAERPGKSPAANQGEGGTEDKKGESVTT
jgi:hypothetical protein